MSAVQESPQAEQTLAEFPEAALKPRQTMYRAHRADRGAWWFDNGPDGRFNLRGDRGTCCTAVTVDTAVRERVRGHVSRDGVVSPALADSFIVSSLTSPLPYRCAAVSHPDAARFGIVRELVTVHEYGVPQEWASLFDETGYDGIFYATAYTTGGASAYALFGKAGAPEPAGGYHATRVMNGEDACRAVGWRVPEQTSRGMEII